MGLFFILGIGVTSIFLPTPLASGCIIFLGYFLGLYFCCYMASVFGQFTYNAIEQNMRVKPETLSKDIHKDKTAIICSLIIYVVITLMGVTFALTMPSINKRQNNNLSSIKMKKAAATYEDIAAVYMEENGVNDLSNMMGANCQNANDYFYIEKQNPQNGCEFITADGTYWNFNSYDGSVTVNDDINNPYLLLLAYS